MYKILVIKFGDSFPILQNLLLCTGTKRLVEHAPPDDTWGDYGDGTGKNKLGQMLEIIRFELETGRKLVDPGKITWGTNIVNGEYSPRVTDRGVNNWGDIINTSKKM